jgi:2-polyprenyl-3-methyl-5-hydroxy-6-metoxy-1,4-benzoquinol methylase
MADHTGFDRDRSKQFMMRMMELLNGSAIAQMISLGNRTGLFDAMAGMVPSTSAEIAGAAGLQERYVRELLNGLVTGGVVEYEPAAGTYVLPPEHATFLISASGPRNLSNLAKMLFSQSAVEPKVAECFRTGGGVPYDEYPEFHSIQREVSGALHDAMLVDGVIPMIEGMPERLAAGIDVADIGCGAGHAVNLMAEAFPSSRFVGIDLSEQAVAMAREEAEELGLDNAEFRAVDVAGLDAERAFDFITTFDAIHDQARPAEVLNGINRALRDDGTWLCVDIAGSSHVQNNLDHPMAPFFYAGSTMHCMTVSLAYDGEGLGAMWGEELAVRMFNEAGFGTVDVRTVPGDRVNNYYVCTK